MSTKRLTKSEKETYRVFPATNGNWAGRCPECDAYYRANDPVISQVAVVYLIQQHEKRVHGGIRFPEQAIVR